MDDFPAPKPKNDRGREHEDSRDAKSDMRAVMLQQPGNGQLGNARANVDGEVEPAIDFFQEMLVGRPELVAHVGGDARFDAAGAEGDEGKPNGQAQARRVHGQRQMAATINNRKIKNRPVFSQEQVRYERAQKGREIDRGSKKMKRLHAHAPRSSGPGSVGVQQSEQGMRPALPVHDGPGHERGQDGGHPVKLNRSAASFPTM